MASETDRATFDSSRNSEVRPEEFPPVTPPSAGFIVQLFLIPALIVMAVVAVWALFGKLADSDNDWKQLATELGSSNEHRRWRAAEGLAQLLRNEELSPPKDGIRLATNPIVVDSLTTLLSESLASTTSSDADVTHQEFLARTLAALDADDKTLPVLAEAMKDSQNIEVRKSSLMAVASIAGRHFDRLTGYSDAIARRDPVPLLSERRLPLKSPTISNVAVLEQLRRSAQDPLPVVRHLAGFALANVSGPESLAQLKVMLSDGNRLAQANAAIGLGRNGSLDCVPALIQLLKDSMKPFEYQPEANSTPEDAQQAEARYQIEESQIARNCLKAVEELWPQIGTDERTELRSVIGRMKIEFFSPNVRQQAGELLRRAESP